MTGVVKGSLHRSSSETQALLRDDSRRYGPPDKMSLKLRVGSQGWAEEGTLG